MRFKKKLGEILIESELLTEEQLQKALADKEKGSMMLGQYLIRNGIVNEEQAIEALSLQLRIGRYHPEKYPTDPSLAEIIPVDIAQKHQVAPVRKKGRLVTVAMTNPLDIGVIDTLESMTDREVEPIICAERDMNLLITSIYGTQTGITGVLGSLQVNAETDEDKAAQRFAEEVQLSSLHDMAEEAPVIRIVNSIFAQAIREGASDIHISPQRNHVQTLFRIDGKLHEVPSPPKSLFLPVLTRMKILSNMDITVSRTPQDGRMTIKMENREINVRASTMPTIYGENLVLRLLDMSAGIYHLNRLGMVREDREKVDATIRKPYGLILSTGPTGSGKTTSLYAILNELNKPDINIITLEDPVEYRIENIRQIQLNVRAGMTFSSGLRSILRQDPDVIMVGEIRDPETAAIAVQAAMTGHRVLSTVHTNDAAGAVTRFIEMGVEPFLISTVLLVSFAQRLVRTVCPYCKEPYRPPAKALAAWGLDKYEKANFQHGRGCYQCLNTGYKGRTGIFEVLINDSLIQDMIVRRCSAHEIARAAETAGLLRNLKTDAAHKVLQGITTLEEAASAVMV